MISEDIHIGDILLVRQWDDMVLEFGVTDKGCIDTGYGFDESMKDLCGEQFQVTKICDGMYGKLYKGIFPSGLHPDVSFFTSDELEPLSDDDWEIANDEDIKLLFG